MEETKTKPRTRLLWLLSAVVLFFGAFGLPVTGGAGFRVDPAACNGSMAECQAEQEEFLLDSETNRRLLLQGDGLGYPSLIPGRPVCSVAPGQSYGGHCLSPPVNPSTRGCTPYQHCRIGGK